jgi:hypothetical protein
MFRSCFECRESTVLIFNKYKYSEFSIAIIELANPKF